MRDLFWQLVLDPSTLEANPRPLLLFLLVRLGREAYLTIIEGRYDDMSLLKEIHEDEKAERLKKAAELVETLRQAKHPNYASAAFQMLTWGQKAAVVVGILTIISILLGHLPISSDPDY